MKIINILGLLHSIERHEFGFDGNAMGRWDERTSTIHIHSNLGTEETRLTEWHEVTHAVLHAIGEPGLGSNEEFVERLSRALFQIADLRIEYV